MAEIINQEYEQVAVNRLRLHERNARQGDVGAIHESINTNGFYGACVVQKSTCKILAGNHRYIAAKESGLSTVPVIWVDVDDDQALRILLADNRTNDLASNDEPALAALLAELAQTDLGLAGTGYSGDDLDQLIADLTDTPPIGNGGDEFDATPAEGPPRTSSGDLWRIGAHRLLVGDSTKPEDVARLMGGDTAALCFTSPPYNLGDSIGLRNGVFNGADTAYQNDSDDDKDAWICLMRGFLQNALTVSECQVVNVQLLSGNKVDLLQWASDFKEHLVDVFIWAKTNPQPAMAEKVASSAFEFLFVFARAKNPTRAVPTADFSRGTFSNVYTSSVGNNSHTEGLHGATFPVEFARHYIENLSPPGATIYEPFLGSGTTLIAANRTNRRCYGMEIDPKFADLCLKRAEAEGIHPIELIEHGSMGTAGERDA